MRNTVCYPLYNEKDLNNSYKKKLMSMSFEKNLKKVKDANIDINSPTKKRKSKQPGFTTLR